MPEKPAKSGDPVPPRIENAVTGSGELRKGVDILLVPSQDVTKEPIPVPMAMAPSQPSETPIDTVPGASAEGDSPSQ